MYHKALQKEPPQGECSSAQFIHLIKTCTLATQSKHHQDLHCLLLQQRNRIPRKSTYSQGASLFYELPGISPSLLLFPGLASLSFIVTRRSPAPACFCRPDRRSALHHSAPNPAETRSVFQRFHFAEYSYLTKQIFLSASARYFM